MHFFRRAAIASIMTICAAAVLWVSNVSAAERGEVRGRVRDSLNNIALRGCLVSSEGGANKAVTDRDGAYRLHLPEGSHTLTFSYMGYEPVSRPVDLVAGTIAHVDVDFGGSAVKMKEMVVTGQAVGEARSINRERNAPNLQNIASSDAIGSFPDQNAAEALGRLPGISVQRDQGEGRFVTVRGISPNLNGSSIDGIPIASAEGGTRATLFDVFPMNIMETLDVTKTLTPDMPADAIGGWINIETPSAYDRGGLLVKGQLGGNYSHLTENWGPSGSFTYANVFGENKQFGLLLSGSYEKHDFGSDNNEASWAFNDETGHYDVKKLEYREYNLIRERIGLVGNFEYRPSDKNSYFLRGLYSYFKDHETRQRTVLDKMITLGSGDDSGLFVGDKYDAVTNPQAGVRTQIVLKDRVEKQYNWQVSGGGKNEFDSWTLDYRLAYSRGVQETPYDNEYTWVNKKMQYAFTGASGFKPKVQVSPMGAQLDPFDLDSYEWDQAEPALEKVTEDAVVFMANLKKELDTAYPAYLKAGLFVSKRKKKDDAEEFVSTANPSSFDTLVGNTAGDGRRAFSDFPLVSLDTTGRFNTQKDAFAVERDLVKSEEGDYRTDENIFAGYLLGNVDFGRMNLLSGVRVESTKLEARGNIIDAAAETVIGSESKTKRYTNVLPGVHLRYNFTDNLQLRAAWTNTISRPQWEQTAFARVEEDGDVTVGNPELDPYKAMNWDLNLSYFSPPLGIASVGVFYKDIDSFIFPFSSPIATGTLTTFRNGDGGHIYGLELAYQQNLSVLADWLKDFSVMANATFSKSSAEVQAEAGGLKRSIDFVGQSDLVGNLALAFEHGGFFARLSGQYLSDYLDEVGPVAEEDRYIRHHFQLDFNAAYTIKDRYTVYLDLINLTNEPFEAYFDKSQKRLSQHEVYGWSARAGIKIAL